MAMLFKALKEMEQRKDIILKSFMRDERVYDGVNSMKERLTAI